VPGFGGWPLDIQYEIYERSVRFAHAANDFRQPRVTARELSMLELMNALTDKPNWNKKIFDDSIIDNWRAEALQKPLISEKAWDWCLAELQDKSRHFEETGCVPTLDTASGCIKSDTLIAENFRKELVEATAVLADVPEEEKDWHPRSKNQVLNLVHPSLFPLVHCRTRVLTKGGQVGLHNPLDSCGQGDVATTPADISKRDDSNPNNPWLGLTKWDNAIPFSQKFQWLPCEVEFQGDENNVSITSYINNLHPTKHKALYKVIEQIINLSIEPWNQVLVYAEYPLHGRTPLRIKTFGSEVDPTSPKIAYPEREDFSEEYLDKAREYIKSDPKPTRENAYGDTELCELYERLMDGTVIFRAGFSDEVTFELLLEWAWEQTYQVVHPEPGDAYSYTEWEERPYQQTRNTIPRKIQPSSPKP
jgi:hypothetical protein